jgi:hypothetical protein
MHVVRLMGTSGGIRAYGTASLVTRVGAGGVEDFAHVARVLLHRRRPGVRLPAPDV